MLRAASNFRTAYVMNDSADLCFTTYFYVSRTTCRWLLQSTTFVNLPREAENLCEAEGHMKVSIDVDACWWWWWGDPWQGCWSPSSWAAAATCGWSQASCPPRPGRRPRAPGWPAPGRGCSTTPPTMLSSGSRIRYFDFICLLRFIYSRHFYLQNLHSQFTFSLFRVLPVNRISLLIFLPSQKCFTRPLHYILRKLKFCMIYTQISVILV